MTVEYTRLYVIGIVMSREPVSFKEIAAIAWPKCKTDEDQEALLDVLQQLVNDDKIVREDVTRGRGLVTVWSMKK